MSERVTGWFGHRISVRQPSQRLLNKRVELGSGGGGAARSDDSLRRKMSGPARDPHCHGRTLAELAARGDVAAVELHELLDQRQPDSSAFVSSGLRCPAAKEPLKDTCQVL